MYVRIDVHGLIEGGLPNIKKELSYLDSKRNHKYFKNSLQLHSHVTLYTL